MNRMRLGVVIALGLGSSLGVSATPSLAIGASSAIGTPTTSEQHLCQVIPRVVRLSVARVVVGPSGDQFVFDFPSQVIVNRASAARDVATTACSLPVAPSGVRSCPAAFDVSYRLSFELRQGKRTFTDVVVLEPTGCQVVRGLGAVRSPSERFYRVLGNALGLSDAGTQRFAGTFRTSGDDRRGVIVGAVPSHYDWI